MNTVKRLLAEHRRASVTLGGNVARFITVYRIQSFLGVARPKGAVVGLVC
jgi:hypothetical protein